MGKNDKNGRVRQFIYQSNGNLFTRNGFAYEIEDYWNGYNGCIDPAPFFTGEYAVDQKLKPMLESLVELLQELISKLQKK